MFAITCEHCSCPIDRSKLALAKFIRDFVMDPTNTRDVEKYGNATYLPYVDPSILFRRYRVPDRNFLAERFWTVPVRLVR